MVMGNETLGDLIEALGCEEKLEPVGWFRWMHHSYRPRMRSMLQRLGLPGIPGSTRWPELAGMVERVGPGIDPGPLSVLVRLAERDPWAFGRFGTTGLAELVWERMSPFGRGWIFAGRSEEVSPEAEWDESVSRWMLETARQGHAVEFTPISGLQAAANAIHLGDEQLVGFVLSDVSSWGAGEVDRIEPDGRNSLIRWEDQLGPVSRRAIDRCLEAAVRMGTVEAARCCLQAGADPNIAVWRLERSCNERYCALSYAISQSRNEDARRELIEVLLDGGADPSGTDYDGRNKPLYSAMSCQMWELAESLLDRGESSTDGDNDCFVRHEGRSRFRSPMDPLTHFQAEDLEWVETEIGSLIPLKSAEDVPAFHSGHAQGGSYGRFLGAACAGDDVEILKRFEAGGLPIEPSTPELLCLISSGAYHCLHYILKRMNAPRAVMHRIRRRYPEFGTARLQFLCRPEPNESNTVEDFDSHGQTPLELPDGTRYFACLDAIAPPGHGHGPVPDNHLFALTVEANYRRRADYLITRGVRLTRELKPIPGTTKEMLIVPEQVKRLLPVVKEVDGVFIWTGVTMDGLWWLDWPEDLREMVKDWVHGPAGMEIIRLAEERIAAQDAANERTSPTTLSEEELNGYPREFWPYLRSADSGVIGVPRDCSLVDSGILARYEAWANENKPDLGTFVPDPRLMKLPWWDTVPRELQPFFHFDEKLQVPSARHDARNAYEKAMMRKAADWKNQMVFDVVKANEVGEEP